MNVRKIGSIEVYTSDENISHYTRKERERFVNELFKEYVGKEIDYLLNAEEIMALINGTTKNNFRATIHHGHVSETPKEINARYDIAFSDDYISLIGNSEYTKTNPEFKVGQNKNHRENTLWHNFNKLIVFDNVVYNLIVNVREYNKRFYIHNTKLKDADSPTSNLVFDSMINQSQKSISSTNIILQPDEYATNLEGIWQDNTDICESINEYDDIDVEDGSSKDELEM